MDEITEIRQYLEETGVLTAMTKTFVKLYEENPRPENAVPFFQQNLNRQFPSIEEYEDLVEELNKSRAELHKYKKIERKQKLLESGGDPNCLHCNDFEPVDEHAENIQNVTSLESLAKELSDCFTSNVEKARAIFTWISQNIAYNTVAFFNNDIEDQSPEKILKTRLAVCEGYARLFERLAKLANLNVKFIAGNGKGYSLTLDKSKPNHAWNAVELDKGKWQLVDSCWGAGKVGESQIFHREFMPTQFTSSSKFFGEKHFPIQSDDQFSDEPLTWEQFIMLDETPELFANFYYTNFSEETIEPSKKKLEVGPNTFVIKSKCEHTKIDSTDQYVILLITYERDAQEQPNIFNVDGEGKTWTCDAEVVANTKYRADFVSKYDNGKDGKGLTVEKFKAATDYSTVGLIEWISDTCLHCLDFENVDKLVEQIDKTKNYKLDELAKKLFTNFTLKANQARAIFTWIFHNINYDESTNSTPKSPDAMLNDKKASNKDYARLFEKLAQSAKLEVKVIEGHWKGYPDAMEPTGKDVKVNHAWNAVKLDDKEWHLVDSFSGSGSFDQGKNFKKDFQPTEFTSSSERFGQTHHPEKPDDQVCDKTLSRLEYIKLETPELLEGFYKQNFREETIEPSKKKLKPGPITFVIRSKCLHTKIQKPNILVLKIYGKNDTDQVEGEPEIFKPFEFDSVGKTWTCSALVVKKSVYRAELVEKVDGDEYTETVADYTQKFEELKKKPQDTKPLIEWIQPNICLHCHDFEEADEKYKQADASVDTLKKIAETLSRNLPSKADKARAIFKWIFIHIEYDETSIPAKSPEDTLNDQNASNKGYAKLFEKLAQFALLDVKVIDGHWKGHHDVDDKLNHAWNAVKLDDDEWYLIDSFSGSGSFDQGKNFKKYFTSTEFTSSSVRFCQTHHPEKPDDQLCDNKLSFSEYIKLETPELFQDFFDKKFSEETIKPSKKKLKVGPKKFVIKSKCWHTKIEEDKRYILVLMVYDLDEEHKATGLGEIIKPFEVDLGGRTWTCDAHVVGKSVYRAELVEEVEGESAPYRGHTVAEYTQTFEQLQKDRRKLKTKPLIEWISPCICLHCENFTVLDDQVENIGGSVTTVSELTDQLFKNANFNLNSKVEKARAIFKWITKYIEYDRAFNATKTLDDIVNNKKASNECYAKLFEKLAESAQLKVRVIEGNWKGYPDAVKLKGKDVKVNHAWNAVKLDDDEWHLIDTFSGTGSFDQAKNFQYYFKPTEFILSLERFGQSHHPQKPDDQLCDDKLSWPEYIKLETPELFEDFYKQNFSEETIEPRTKKLKTGPNKFVIKSKCRHTKINQQNVPKKQKIEEQHIPVLTVYDIENQNQVKGTGKMIKPFAVDSEGNWTCDVHVERESGYRAELEQTGSTPGSKSFKTLIEWIQSDICLHCHNFERVDQHVEGIGESVTTVEELAKKLFKSLDTKVKKARAIFIWISKYIKYDTNNIDTTPRPVNPLENILQDKLALSEGFAGLFEKLAQNANLDVRVIKGHWKGHANAATDVRENHAWNAVKLDDDEWHLVDACSGAGCFKGKDFKENFKPTEFTLSSERFGQTHHPEKLYDQLCDNKLSTDEYYALDQTPELLNDFYKQNFSEETIQPSKKKLQAGRHTFVIKSKCRHTQIDTQKLLVLTVYDKAQDASGEPKIAKPFVAHPEGYWMADYDVVDNQVYRAKFVVDLGPGITITFDKYNGRKGTAAYSELIEWNSKN